LAFFVAATSILCGHFVKRRAFTASEAKGLSGLPEVIAWQVWESQFHEEENVIGRPIVLNGIPAIVAGVAAEGFHGTQFAPNFEIGVPIVSYVRVTRRASRLADRSQPSVIIIGKCCNVIHHERRDGDPIVVACAQCRLLNLAGLETQTGVANASGSVSRVQTLGALIRSPGIA
jgi:hypothetical protein